MPRTAEYTAQERAQRRASGLCCNCNSKTEPGRSQCARHLKYNRDYFRKYYYSQRRTK